MVSDRPPVARSDPASSPAGVLLRMPSLGTAVPEMCRDCRPLAAAHNDAARLVESVFLAAPVGLALLDADLRCVIMNPTAAEYLGIDGEAAVGRTPAELWPAMGAHALERLHRVVETGEAVPDIEFTGDSHARSGGSRTWVHAHRPLVDVQGHVAGVIVSVHEITNRVRAAEEARRSREALEAVFRASPLPVAAVDAAGRVTHWNLAAEQLFGWQADEIVGKEPPVIPDSERAAFQKLLATPPESLSGQLVRRVARDGRTLDIAAWTAPILQDGQVAGMVGVLEDVSDRLAELRLANAVHALAEGLASALGTRDVAAAALRACLGALDADRGEISLVRGTGVEGLLAVAAHGPTPPTQSWRPVVPDGPVAVILRDGSPFWFDSAAELARRFPSAPMADGPSGARGIMPLAVQDGVMGVLSIAREASRPFAQGEREFARTASHLVAQALARARHYEAERSGRDRLERVYNVAAALGAATTRADVSRVLAERILSALDADAFALAIAAPDGATLVMEQHAGYPDEVMTQHRVMPVDAQVPSVQAYRTRRPVLLDEPALGLVRQRATGSREGNTGTRSHAALPLLVGDRAIGSLVVGWRDPRSFDVAEVRYLEAVAGACAQAIVRATLYERAIRDEAMLEEVVRQMPVGVVIAEAPGGRVLIESDRNRAIWRGDAGPMLGVPDYARWHGRRPGGATYRPTDWPIARSLVTGEVIVDEEIEIERLDGSHGVISVSAAPVRDADDRIVAAVAVRTDVTERNEAAAMRETFMGVLSHELRTPTTLVLGGTEVLAAHWEGMADPERRSLIDDVRAEAGRLNRMIDNLVVLASAERGALPMIEPEPVLLQRWITAVVSSEEARWAGARFRTRIAPTLPAVLADATALEQLIRNLLGNAAKYAAGQATVSAVLRGRNVELIVSDRGPGIAADERESIFRPFYRSSRTARVTAGSGIGLFVCRRLVEAMGGTLRADDRRGGGTRFVATLRAVGD